MKNKLLTIIKPLIATIPYAGGVATALGDYEANIKHKKLEDFLKRSLSELGNKQESIVKKQEEIVKVLQYISHFVTRDPIPEKIKIYTNCLVQYCTTDQEIETMVNIVQLIENLMPDDIEVLKKLSGNNRVDESLDINENTDHEIISKYNLSVKKLEARGLIVLSAIHFNQQIEFKRKYNEQGWPYSFFIQFYQILHIGQGLLKIWK